MKNPEGRDKMARTAFNLFRPNRVLYQLLHRTNSTCSRARLKENLVQYMLDRTDYWFEAFRTKVMGFMEPEPSFESEPFSSIDSNWKFSRFVDNYGAGISISSNYIFFEGFNAIKRYINDRDQEQPLATMAFHALERFFHDQEKHEKSLQHLISTKQSLTESYVACILAKHFLSQLLPHTSNYFLDNKASWKLDSCPCGCGEPIQFGITELGSPQLFHGHADIVLFPCEKDWFSANENETAVFTLKKNGSECFGHKLFEEADDWYDEDYRYDEEDENFESAEVKANTLMKEITQRQVFKQAISMALCKHKNNILEEISDSRNKMSMVPVCAIAKDSYNLTLYDAANDYLLKMDTDLPIFDHNNCLQFSAIIDMFLFIYHNLFCSCPESQVLEALQKTCNLVSVLGEERYDLAVQNSKSFCQIDTRIKEKEIPRKKKFFSRELNYSPKLSRRLRNY